MTVLRSDNSKIAASIHKPLATFGLGGTGGSAFFTTVETGRLTPTAMEGAAVDAGGGGGGGGARTRAAGGGVKANGVGGGG